MLIKLTGGKVYDPAHQIDGKVMDIYIVMVVLSNVRTMTRK